MKYRKARKKNLQERWITYMIYAILTMLQSNHIWLHLLRIFEQRVFPTKDIRVPNLRTVEYILIFNFINSTLKTTLKIGCIKSNHLYTLLSDYKHFLYLIHFSYLIEENWFWIHIRNLSYMSQNVFLCDNTK